MKTQTPAFPYKGFRFPVEIIGHCTWLYFRFSLSFRDVEEIMAERGVVLTYETIRQWCLKFGQTYAHELKRRRPKTGDKWHAGRACISRSMAKPTTSGERLISTATSWIYASQSRRNKHAAKKFFRKLLKGLQYVPRVIITDKLASYAAAKREIMSSVEHRQHKGLNNRAERSHQPTRQRERTMRRFKSPGQAQRFLSAFGPILDHFQPKRHRLTARDYRALMQDRFQVWNEVTSGKTAV
jgi:putative transposase